MQVIAGYKQIPDSVRGCSLALGNFDGVHAGHRAVLQAARAQAHPLAVATFEPPPRAFFRPDDPPFRIYTPNRRNQSLQQQGVSCVFELPFNAQMAAMTDEMFARDVLAEGLGAAHVSVGFDFRFGRGRMGDAARLASLGRALGFGVTIVEKIEALGAKASSTAIREALIAGEPERVQEILGAYWSVEGRVETGEKRGRTLGFPTANLHLGELINPKHGVYAVAARLMNEQHWRGGVANFGRTPTTGLRDPLLETFLFDFDGDLYGQTLEIALIEYLRPELKFDSVDAMVDQMHIDTKMAREIVETEKVKSFLNQSQ